MLQLQFQDRQQDLLEVVEVEQEFVAVLQTMVIIQMAEQLLPEHHNVLQLVLVVQVAEEQDLLEVVRVQLIKVVVEAEVVLQLMVVQNPMVVQGDQELLL